jgi:hypothetical protein
MPWQLRVREAPKEHRISSECSLSVIRCSGNKLGPESDYIQRAPGPLLLVSSLTNLITVIQGLFCLSYSSLACYILNLFPIITILVFV